MIRPAGDFDRTYEQDMLVLRKPWHWAITFIAIGILLILPILDNYLPIEYLSTHSFIVSNINKLCYTIIALQGLNILTGLTGQISLGQAAFMMVGGYIAALGLTEAGLPLVFTIPLAALGTGLIGLLFGLPSLRVKGFYLAMATLAAQFIIPWLSRNTFRDYLGGTNGFIEVPPPVIFGFEFGEVTRFVYISIFCMLIMTVLALNIKRSRLGRAFVAIRDNDLAAELLGVNLFSYKLRAFFLAAAFAGVAGALQSHSLRGVGTEFGFTLEDSVLFLGMLVIGGMGSNLGPFFGAVFVIAIEEFALWLGATLAGLPIFEAYAAGLLTSFRPIFFGVLLILFLIFEPRGLAHRWYLLKAAWRIRPFAR